MTYTPSVLINKDEWLAKKDQFKYPVPEWFHEEDIERYAREMAVTDASSKEITKIKRDISGLKELTQAEKEKIITARIKAITQENSTFKEKILEMIKGYRKLEEGESYNEVNIRGSRFMWFKTEFSNEVSEISAICKELKIEWYKSY